MHMRKKIIQLKKSSWAGQKKCGDRVEGGVCLPLNALAVPITQQGILGLGDISQRFIDDLLSDSWAYSGKWYSFSSLYLLLFPFPPLSHRGLSSKRVRPSKCRTCGRAGPCLTSLPSTSSARKVGWACHYLCHLYHPWLHSLC